MMVQAVKKMVGKITKLAKLGYLDTNGSSNDIVPELISLDKRIDTTDRVAVMKDLQRVTKILGYSH